MTEIDRESDSAWVEDACGLFDEHAQKFGWERHVYSDRLRTLLARIAEVEGDAEARFREIERLYYAEGKDLSWRAAHMRAIAEDYFTDRAALTEKGTDDE